MEMVSTIAEKYSNLETLNMSDNEIAIIENLKPLGHSLKTLDLSRNRISNLSSGLRDLQARRLSSLLPCRRPMLSHEPVAGPY